MSIVAEFGVDAPLLREALGVAPGVRLQCEGVQRVGDDVRLHCWVGGPDVAAFEAGLERDSTVADWHRKATDDRWRLYRVRYSARGVGDSVYADLAAVDALPLRGTATADGWRFRCRFPDREALVAFRERCTERGYGFDLTALYGGDERFPGGRYGVTDSQREALVAAFEAGYFEVPRRATLADVSARLNVSEQAVSVRIRRGLAALLAATVAESPDDDPPSRGEQAE